VRQLELAARRSFYGLTPAVSGIRAHGGRLADEEQGEQD
jgi:hypothetical protein